MRCKKPGPTRFSGAHIRIAFFPDAVDNHRSALWLVAEVVFVTDFNRVSMRFHLLPRRIATFLLTLMCAAVFPVAAWASDHGGGGGAAPAPLVFTVNLGERAYLQVGLILQAATPEAGHELEVYRPKIQHEIIMLLSGRDEARLRTLEGKHELVDDILEAVNHIIHEDEKTGVNEVLISSFVIQ